MTRPAALPLPWCMCVAVAATGCASLPRSSPRATLERLAVAIEHGDAAALHALLPAGARHLESREALQRRLATEQRELRERLGGLGAALASGASPYVDVSLEQGGTLEAVDDPDGWRVSRAGLGAATATSPTDAARLFRESVLRRSHGDVLSTLSSRARGALEADLASLANALVDPAALRVLIVGPQRAEIILPDGRRLIVVREGSAWRVDGVE